MDLKQRFARLVDVKSLVTLLLTGEFLYLCTLGKVQADQFLTVFTVVISFYFGVQVEKHKGGGGQ